MLRSRVLCMHIHRRCLSYFSNAFNNLANQVTPAASTHSQQFNESGINANNLDLDIFVNPEHRQMDILEKLLKLRKLKECSSVPLLPNLVVKQLLDYTGPQDAIPVLRSPLQHGVFIDQFTGCHLIDTLLHNGNVREAAQVSAILIERDLCNNELLAALLLRSLYAFLKDYQPEVAEKAEETAEVEKVRVKFLRNYSEDASEKTEEQILSAAMIKVGSSGCPVSLKELGLNISLLGLVLGGRLAEAEKCLAENQGILYKDVLQVSCKLIDLLKYEKTSEFIGQLNKALNECTQTNSFDEMLESRVKLHAKAFEPQLISEYEKDFKEWETNFQSAVENQIKIDDVQKRVESIRNTMSTLQTMRQNLWFFENKEDIDIQIFKKKVFYPRRWFGKKKKPKTVDTFYVPPQISRAN